MKAVLVIGIVLVALGVSCLGYFASPVRFLMMAYVPHTIDLRIPSMGGLSLALGITLLFESRWQGAWITVQLTKIISFML